jgi:plastocyanin
MRRLPVLLLVFLAVACNKEITDPVQPAEVTVLATSGNQFLPPQTSIRVGGKVTWEFQAAHTVTFTQREGVPVDIQLTQAGASDFRVFSVEGVYRYDCDVEGHQEFGIINVIEP